MINRLTNLESHSMTRGAEIADDRRQTTISGLLTGASYWIALAVLASFALLVYVILAEINANVRATLPMMIEGTAHRPFQYRMLLPGMVTVMRPYLPLSLAAQLHDNPAIGAALDELGYALDPAAATLYLAGLYVSLLVFALAFYALASDLGYQARIMTVIGVLSILLFFMWAHIYDLPIVAAFTGCLALMRRGWLNAYLAAFVMACLAKETALLLILVYIFTRAIPYRNDGVTWLLLAEQIVLYGLTRAALLLRYAGNPGGVVEWHLPLHLPALGFVPALTVGLALALAGLGWLIWRDHQRKPRFLYLVLSACLPVLAITYLLFGMPFEWRVFLEVWPVALLLAAPAPGERGPVCALAPDLAAIW
jgi:hypothetical protein